MLKFLIFSIFFYVLYRFVKGAFTSDKKIKRGRNGAIFDEMVQDPLCETYIPRRESFKRVVEGQEYCFCSKNCADKFELEGKG